MLSISMRGRERIFQALLKEHIAKPVCILEELMFHVYPRGMVPGIVRRGDAVQKNMISVGFVHPELLNGSRVRVPANVRADEIADKVTPYALPHFGFEPRTKAMAALCEVNELDVCKSGRMGVVGSVGMEILTGAPYSNNDSDLDLLLKDCSLNEITDAFAAITQIVKNHGVDADIEIELTNGYGVKAAELFIGSYTLLGKSLSDVQLLERKTVLDSLKIKED